MKRSALLYLLLITCSSASFSQNIHLIDSLRKKLPTSIGLSEFKLLNKVAWEFRSAYPDSTIFYAQKAYALGVSLNLTTDLAEPLNFIGVAYNYKGDRLSAYDYYDRAIKLAIAHKDSLQIAYSNNNLGRLFFEQGLLSRSYNYFVEALIIFEEVRDSTGLAYTYQSLARLYKSQRDNNKAEANYLKALNMRLALQNTPDITSAYIQTGRFYQENNDHDQALYYLAKADSTATSIGDEINVAEVKTYTAKTYLVQNKLDEAAEICLDGLNAILRKNNVRMQPQAYLTMGQIKFEMADYPEAKRYFNLALTVAAQTKDLTSKMDAHYALWKLSEKEKDKSGQLQNQNQYLILKDSIKDLDLARQVERLQFEIEIERKEKENELLKVNQANTEAIIQQQKLQNVILIIIILSVSILVFVQWRNNKKRTEVNKKLAQQNQFIQNQRQEIIDQNEKLSRRNQQLSDLNHEKDTLMSIVAHDLKSPLNRIKGITDLMEMEGGLTTDQQHYIQLAKDATQAGLDLIKDLLDVHMLEENVKPHYSTFNIHDFLQERTELLRPAATSKGIELLLHNIDSHDVDLDSNYLGRIVDNLVTNAIKFSPRNSSVRISASQQDEHLWIAIKDQGPGFSDKDKTLLFQKFKKLSARPTAGETSNGLGLAIVKILVDRMDGQIELISEQGKGSEFIIKLRLHTA